MNKLNLRSLIHWGVAVGFFALVSVLSTGVILSARGNGNILVCIHTQTGAVRVVGSVSDCNNQETAQPWNVADMGGGGLSGYETKTDSCEIPAYIDDSQLPTRVDCQVQCTTGKVPLAGGYSVDSFSQALEVHMNYPTNMGWRTVVQWFAEETAPAITVYVVCADES